MATTAAASAAETLRTLPGDDARQILWRFADRYDLQMLVQSVRAVARGPVARLVANGGRHSHEWTPEKAALLKEFDAAGITSVHLEPADGGFIEGPKNLALALVAFELAWVDAGAATGSLATHLALGPIHERGTAEQREFYMRMCGPNNGEAEPWRGAFALTEPLPYVGVETGLLSGRVRVAEWPEGGEPTLEVDKRGRFITNMGFANFVTAAVDSDDARVKGSCFVILHETDPGTFDRGTPARKLVHQLSSTNDPIFRMRVPASRIVGGYTVKDGVIVPNFSHGEVIEAVFKHTRVTVGLMTAAKLLSAIEPLIRYHRDRFRGSGAVQPGSPRYELGIQQKQDATHRLLEVWATGEAAASLGFAATRLFDELDPLEAVKDQILESKGIGKGMAAFKAMRKYQQLAVAAIRNNDDLEAGDPLIRYTVLDAIGNVLCPAVKLWNTGHGANVMREAVSLMGGYGITEDCPGFLANKWMDAQLEATYEGPEVVQRRQLSLTMTSEVFLAQFQKWIGEMRRLSSERPGTGACALATAMQLWKWTLERLQDMTDSNGAKLYHSNRQGVTFPMADALSWLLAARQQILDVVELEHRGADNPTLAEGLAGTVQFLTDLCHMHVARAAGEVGRICAELVYGYQAHPSWDSEKDCSNCYTTDELIELEATIPGIGSTAFDVIRPDGGHPLKAGPCARFEGVDNFARMRAKLDGCLAGSQLAKDRAADALTKVMIPAALDYPA